MAIDYWQPAEPDRLLATRLRLIELLDDLPLDGCIAQTRVRVIPIFLDSYITPDTSSIARTAPGHGDDGGSIALPPSKPTPYPDLAQTIPRDAITDVGGWASFTVELGAAMAQVISTPRLAGDLPVGLCFDQSFSANAFGVQLPWTSPVGVEWIKYEGKDPYLVVDLAKSIVGDTSSTQATLWFQLHGAPRPGDRYVCDIVDIARLDGGPAGNTHLIPTTGDMARPDAAMGASASNALPPDTIAGVNADADLGLSSIRKRVTLDPSRAMTDTVTFEGLRPGALYGYLLKVHMADGKERVLTQGRFRTFKADPEAMNIAFASCHRPSDENSLNRWKALAHRDDQDVLFLMGDQIYADNIDKMYTRIGNWRDRYIQRYNQLFAYQPMRDTLRTRPTYMMIDDHEIVDDWGVVSVDQTRLEAGLEAYRIFQHAHNPGGFSSPIFDYHFRRGQAAFYVTDNRSARGKTSDYPVLGKAQYDRLLAWAKSSEVAEADLVFVVVPVPPGILPIAAIEKFVSAVAATAPIWGAALGALGGAVVGGIGGFLVGGPAGAVIGATYGAEVGAGLGFVGGAGADIYYEYLEDNILDPDVRDAWTYDKNLSDLVRLLDVLFDVANDVQPNGKSGPRPKGVFVMSGDYHFGAIHKLISKRSQSRHGLNREILQVTSSPISTSPENSDSMNKIIDTTASGTFPLDGEHFVSKYLGRVMQRNFGRIAFDHVGPGRRYQIQVFVEGERDTLAHLYELDLDKKPVILRDTIGDVLAARGRISLLRVNDRGTKYGPTSDRIDVEVVVQLDTAPGRAFGFQLRKDSKLAARKAMLKLLRTAFANNQTVSIDYKRNGQANGTIIRASVPSE